MVCNIVKFERRFNILGLFSRIFEKKEPHMSDTINRTVEKGAIGGSILCEWKIDGSNGEKTHLNYGKFNKQKLIKILSWQQLI